LTQKYYPVKGKKKKKKKKKKGFEVHLLTLALLFAFGNEVFVIASC
jgi:hypothetical protein